jgi:RTX calcium-binding nonapeptide repeat (4 copies)
MSRLTSTRRSRLDWRVRRWSVVWLVAGALAVLAVGVASAALVAGGPGNDTLNGTASDDSLYGREGDDTLNGLAGNDDLDGGPGADTLNGGAGTDAATYGGRTATVTVTMDGKANDGEGGEGDKVGSDVEAIYGGKAGDTLTGGRNADTIDGQGGNDSITGGNGVDFLFGGDGNDTINSRDGKAETVDCGAGNADRIIGDKSDKATGCELKGAPFSRRVNGEVGSFWNVFRDGSRTFTRPSRLEVTGITPADATVKVTCSGSGCPFKSRSFKPKKNKVGLLSSFKKSKLRSGTKIVVLVVASDALGKYVSYTMRRTDVPKRVRACVEPGGTDPVACT